MKLYWSSKDIPELAPLSPRQRQQAWKVCYRNYAFKYWQTWVSIGVLSTLVTVGLQVGTAGVAIAGGLGAGIFSQTVTHVLRPHFRNYVNGTLQQTDG
jgi:hypothetical protein